MNTIRRLLRYMSGYNFMLIIVLICMIAGAVCTVRATYYLKPLINDVLVPLVGQGNPDFSEARRLFLLIALMYVIEVLSSVIQGIIMDKISTDVMSRIRQDMFHVMEHLPLAYFNTHSRGELMNYYSSDVDSLSMMLRQSFPRIIEGTATIIAITVTMLTSDIRMAGVVIGCIAVIGLVLRLIAGNQSRHFAEQQKATQDLNAYGEEMISGRAEIKAFSQEKNTEKRYAQLNSKLYDSMSRADFFSTSMYDFSGGFSYIGYAAVAAAGSMMALSGMTDAGTVGVFLQYYRKMYAPVSRITKQMSNILSAKAGADRLFAFLDLASEPDDGKAGLVSCIYDEDGLVRESEERRESKAWKMPDGTLIPCKGGIEFKDVDFAYETDGPTILHDLSLSAAPGQTIAIVGTTGAGKTTMVNLLSRFYEIADGTITIDGIDIKNIHKDDLRHAVGCVLQDTHLFGMPVRENIRFGRLDADDEDIENAAKLANAHRFITLLENGYDTVLQHDGSTLSQGQRQLLAISRAAVGDFPILVLDEATSSIDSRTELLVSRGLDALMKNKTVIVIAHRLSTIRNADRIIVLDQGRIAETGTHEELMEAKGIYYRLYSSTTDAA